MSRPAKILLWSGLGAFAILALGLVLLTTFDWNRLKPWINMRVSEATGRPFAIHGNLSLSWDAPQAAQDGWRGWLPWPRLNAQNVNLGNPDWASTAPNMAEVRQLNFSIRPLPLINKRIVIPSLELDTPQLTLERDKDGRTNWTFPKKENASTWQLELQQLILNNGWVHLVDEIKRADVRANIETLDSAGAGEYRIGWKLNGTFNGEKVSGGGKAGAILSLQTESGQYPLQAYVRIGKTEIDAKGTLTQPRNLAALDLRLKLSGASMAQLYPIIGVVLPETRPFVTEGRLIGKLDALGGNWTYEKFTGKMGASDLAGTLHYRAREPRPLLEGSASSNFLNFRDLAPLIGADSNQSKAKRGDKNVQPANKVLPVAPFRTERWTKIDANVRFTGRRIVRDEHLPIDNLATRFDLNNGVLALAPLKFGMAGGTLDANLRLNGRSKPVAAELKLSARHLKLNQLFPKAESMRASLGEVNGDASLSATGNSIAELLGSSNGELKALVNQGTVSKLLLEEMGLNLGSVVLTKLFGDRQVKLECAAVDFTVAEGVMKTRIFVIDTEDATIYVNGDIDLAREQLALDIRPQSKGLRLLSLRSPLYVSGPFKKPKVGVDKRVLALKAGSAVTLGALAPVATALLPLVNLGPGENSECATLLTQVGKPAEAPPPGKKAVNADGK
jgi:uncharacterized protein involved in outer membrane biogenesis